MPRARTTAWIAGLVLPAVVAILWWRLRQEPVRTVHPGTEPAAIAELARWRPAALRSPAGRVVGYAWAAPMTAVGLVLGGLAGVRPRRVDGALLFAHARGLPRRMLRWRGFSAATLGHVIVAVGDPGPGLLRHELVHVRQAERLGPLFPVAYLAGLVRYGYRANPFERAAYGASDGPAAA